MQFLNCLRKLIRIATGRFFAPQASERSPGEVLDGRKSRAPRTVILGCGMGL
jgi:hypothetical protein